MLVFFQVSLQRAQNSWVEVRFTRCIVASAKSANPLSSLRPTVWIQILSFSQINQRLIPVQRPDGLIRVQAKMDARGWCLFASHLMLTVVANGSMGGFRLHSLPIGSNQHRRHHPGVQNPVPRYPTVRRHRSLHPIRSLHSISWRRLPYRR